MYATHREAWDDCILFETSLSLGKVRTSTNPVSMKWMNMKECVNPIYNRRVFLDRQDFGVKPFSTRAKTQILENIMKKP